MSAGTQDGSYQGRIATAIFGFHKKETGSEPCTKAQSLLLREQRQGEESGRATRTDTVADDGNPTWAQGSLMPGKFPFKEVEPRKSTHEEVEKLQLFVSEKALDDRVFLTGIRACTALHSEIDRDTRP